MPVLRPFALALLALALTGCGGLTKQIKNAKALQADDRFEELAALSIDCAPGDTGCNQLHLLKGDACYRLGKDAQAADDPGAARTRYACADTHLETGLEITDGWDADVFGPEDVWYTNWCESLRQLQDLSSGDEARVYTDALMGCAEAFDAAAPDHVGAIYFHNSARYAQIQPMLLDDEAALQCPTLEAIADALAGAAPRAAGTAFEPNYDRLQADIAGARQAVCP